MDIELFNFSVDLLQAIIWQYAESTNLISLITQKQDWYTVNQTDFWEQWYANVFNLQTADLFGIVVWSYILNVPLYVLQTPEPSDKPLWGFNSIVGAWPTLANTYLNFNNSNFSTRGTIYTLTENEQRFLLRLRYFQLSNRGDITDINSFLNYLVTTSSINYTGTIYALDGLNMTMTYVFTADDFNVQLFQIIRDQDIFPRPAGVRLKFVVNFGVNFGFNAIDGAWPNLINTNQNFENGNLLSPYIT